MRQTGSLALVPGFVLIKKLVAVVSVTYPVIRAWATVTLSYENSKPRQCDNGEANGHGCSKDSNNEQWRYFEFFYRRPSSYDTIFSRSAGRECRSLFLMLLRSIPLCWLEVIITAFAHLWRKQFKLTQVHGLPAI